MKSVAITILMLSVLLLPLLLAPSASAAVTLTGSWQIETRNELNETTTQFQAKGFLNITVYPPSTLITGGVRSVTVSGDEELARYSLGYYSSGMQNDSSPKKVSFNLGAFPELIHGATLLVQIRGPTDAVEFSAAVSVREDIEALLEQQRQLFFGALGDLQRKIDYLSWQVDEMGRNLTNYIITLGVVIGFIVAYVTRDRWLNRKRKDDEDKSATEFEVFLETFVLERYQTGDLKEHEVKINEG